jgi:hypothetical protein
VRPGLVQNKTVRNDQHCAFIRSNSNIGVATKDQVINTFIEIGSSCVRLEG